MYDVAAGLTRVRIGGRKTRMTHEGQTEDPNSSAPFGTNHHHHRRAVTSRPFYDCLGLVM